MAKWSHLWAKIQLRLELVSLEELQAFDWPEPPPNVYIPRQYDPSPPQGTQWNLPPRRIDYGLGFIQQYFSPEELQGYIPITQKNLEAPLIVLAFVLVPLARAEVNRARRQFDAALRDLRWVLDSIGRPRTVLTHASRVSLSNYRSRSCCWLKRCWTERTPSTKRVGRRAATRAGRDAVPGLTGRADVPGRQGAVQRRG